MSSTIYPVNVTIQVG